MPSLFKAKKKAVEIRYNLSVKYIAEYMEIKIKNCSALLIYHFTKKCYRADGNIIFVSIMTRARILSVRPEKQENDNAREWQESPNMGL